MVTQNFSYVFLQKFGSISFNIQVRDTFLITFLKIVTFIFACGLPIITAPLVEKITHSSLNYLVSVKIQLNIFVWMLWVFLWTLYSVPLIFMSILSPMPCSLDCDTFKVSLEISLCKSSNIFVFQYYIGQSKSFVFRDELQNQVNFPKYMIGFVENFSNKN